MNYFNLYQELLEKDQFIDNKGLFDSKDYISQLFSTPLNFEINSFENKLKLFCPYFLPLIEVANNPKCLEFYSGIGIFLEIAKMKNRESEIFYMNNHNGNSEKLAKRVYPDINIVNGTENIKYDFIFTDGTFNHFSDEEIIQKIDLIDGIINKGGVLCLLVNLDPLTLRKDFDIVKVHQLLQNKNFISIWGKNTFCSLWSKK